MFKDVIGEHATGNRLVLAIYPEEAIHLSVQVKTPGPNICLRTGNLQLKYAEMGQESVLEAYEKVILDCIQGDQMLFWRQDGIVETWKLITPILDDCIGENCKFQQLHKYAAGSWGPDAAHTIVEEIMK